MKERKWEIGKKYLTVKGEMLECVGIRTDSGPLFEGRDQKVATQYRSDGTHRILDDIKPERELVYWNVYAICQGSSYRTMKEAENRRDRSALWTEERDLNDPEHLRIVWKERFS